MTESLRNDYSPPVVQLISLGEKGTRGPWLDYTERGITVEHIPELIRIIQDIESFWPEENSETDKIWTPIHAWRALGQLQAMEAIEPLIDLLHKNEELDSDWIGEDVPKVMGMIGPACIPALEAYLISSNKKVWAATSVGQSLSKIGIQHPGSRVVCIDALQTGLEDFTQNDEIINGFLISYLADLKATEAAPLVEHAYQADKVDISIMGDYEEYQIEVGLLKERLTPPPRYQWLPNPEALWGADKKAKREAARRERQKAKKEKQKRKRAKKARRRKK